MPSFCCWLSCLASSSFPRNVAVSGKGSSQAPLQALLAGIEAKQQQQNAVTCSTCAPPTPQVIYAPLFDVPESSGSEIVLNCRSAHKLEVTPTFFTIEGKPIVGDVIHLQPAEMRFVNTKSLIPTSQRNRHRWGGIALSYTGNLMEGWAQLTLHGIRGGGSVNVLFAVVNLPRANTIDAVWVSPRNGEALIALGNSSDKPVHANLIFSNGESRQADVAPFATKVVRRHSEDWGQSDDNRARAVSINYTGPAGSLIPTGFVSSANGKFTSSIRFYNTPNVVQSNLYANNLRLKNSAPRMVLRNTSADSLTAHPRFLTASGTPADMVKLPALRLRPNEVAEVDLRPLIAAAANRSDLDSVSVQVLNSGAPGSLIGALYSRNKTTGVTYDVPLRDSGPPRASTGGYPVRLDGDYTTVLSITNAGDKPGQFTLQVNYEGGKYELDLITFNPGETKTYDIRQLRDEQTPDRNGHAFPRELTTGQIRWSMRGNGSVPLFGRVEVVSLSDGVSSSYSCFVCCPYSFYDGSIVPEAPSIFVDAVQPFTARQRERDCYANVYGPNDVSAGITWNSVDPSVATVDSSGQATGVSPGTAGLSATWTTDIWLQDWEGSCTYDQGTTAPNGYVGVVCSTPTSETTTFAGWADSDGLPTIGKWTQTLLPASISFSGRTVTEQDPGGGGPDNCWFPNSAISPQTAITGGSWTVTSSNEWKFDYIGLSSSTVNYYRAQGRDPCSVTVPQRMVISCSTGNPLTYRSNTLGFVIGTTTVTSIRDGSQAAKTWP